MGASEKFIFSCHVIVLVNLPFTFTFPPLTFPESVVFFSSVLPHLLRSTVNDALVPDGLGEQVLEVFRSVEVGVAVFEQPVPATS